MSTPPSLCNLPNELAINIFNRIGFKSILNLRKVCRDLRNRIDDIKPEANLLDVSIYVNDSEIRFKYESAIQTLDEEKSETYTDWVEYEKTVESERCIVSCCGAEKIVNGEEKIVNGDIVELASRDLQLILKFQKKIIKEISFLNVTKYSNNFLKFLDTFKSFLALENRLLKVDNFQIDTNDQKSVITALSLIDPQTIYSIDIYNWNEGILPLDIAEITEMEQWKTAKFFVSNFRITGISAHNFRHFSHIGVMFQSISAEYLLDLKKILQNSSELKCFEIQYETFEGREQFLEKMGPSITIDDRLEWYFRMSTTDEYVLRIRLEEGSITFNRFPVHHVPEDAVIQNE